VTHVSVARPHYLDLETTPVSESVKRIVDFISAHPKCTRRQLFEALAPAVLPVIQAPAENPATPAELTPEASAVISDLHWLVHQGHVIEFANGTLDAAKRPIPKPAKPADKNLPPAVPDTSPQAKEPATPPAASPSPVPEPPHTPVSPVSKAPSVSPQLNETPEQENPPA
jgi:hypothetical protein